MIGATGFHYACEGTIGRKGGGPAYSLTTGLADQGILIQGKEFDYFLVVHLNLHAAVKQQDTDTN